jgi:hypothetical protein
MGLVLRSVRLAIELRREVCGQMSPGRKADHRNPRRINSEFCGAAPHQSHSALGIGQRRVEFAIPSIIWQAIGQCEPAESPRDEPGGDVQTFLIPGHVVIAAARNGNDRRTVWPSGWGIGEPGRRHASQRAIVHAGRL